MNVLELTVLEHSLSVADLGERADLPLGFAYCGRDGRECPPIVVRSRIDPRQGLMHDAKLVILSSSHSSVNLCANFQSVVFVLCLHLHELSRKTLHAGLL